MLTILSSLSPICNLSPRRAGPRQASNQRHGVTVRATPQEAGKQVFGTSMLISSMNTVLPALAIVDDRLNGDGTGLPLGINDGALGIILASVPLAIFSLYFIAGKQDAGIENGGKNDDSGLSL
ncbi:Photosystem II PsbW, class 2 [Ostreococcus tauri]|uniref:PSII 6.1 kDa protein n=1 Tax=Ostreococcus tauri TaxID=70448 RepID=A0A090MDN1_OSTTA|nr:Photosystem II PsbW, class 2 [Ostreococcus tauri]CEG01031.1 Photosystem II PsbW, class 2 [Ostreococcus tauri]|eukprot:XP_003075040.2 Photosystem II PsbW, class 2 [Ostreococcus tauri]